MKQNQSEKQDSKKLCEKLVSLKEYGVTEPFVSNVEQVRLTIPGPTGIKIKPQLLWKLLKEVIGKDLSKFSMPVFINEPLSILQKPSEFMFFSHYMT